jgi:hypothetical protein
MERQAIEKPETLWFVSVYDPKAAGWTVPGDPCVGGGYDMVRRTPGTTIEEFEREQTLAAGITAAWLRSLRARATAPADRGP